MLNTYNNRRNKNLSRMGHNWFTAEDGTIFDWEMVGRDWETEYNRVWTESVWKFNRVAIEYQPETDEYGTTYSALIVYSVTDKETGETKPMAVVLDNYGSYIDHDKYIDLSVYAA